ncbi:MAG TPA: glycosyltransferase [Terriglobales bacterium]|nr:glycosyltransferase [Terriglobales bacterium]
MRTDASLIMVLSGFPRRSETFAVNEVLALEERGVLAGIFATKQGEIELVQPAAKRLLPRVQLLPEGSPHEQAEFLAKRVRGENVKGIHGYFAHTPAEVAAHAATLLHKPYGFSVHAKDARKLSAELLASRARDAACVIACNPDVAGEIQGSGAKVHLIPHGVDLERFKSTPLPAGEPFRLVAVGRLVEKKGFHILLAAVARLSHPFLLRIIGDGPERSRLASLIEDLGIADRVSLCGAKTHEELPDEYAAAHVLVAPSLKDREGDRDGLPNVVLEAMASGRAVVGTDAGALSSALIPEQTGVVVPQGDAISLAQALESLASQPELLGALGCGARKFVSARYEVGQCTERFCRVIREAYA